MENLQKFIAYHENKSFTINKTSISLFLSKSTPFFYAFLDENYQFKYFTSNLASAKFTVSVPTFYDVFEFYMTVSTTPSLSMCISFYTFPLNVNLGLCQTSV